jgi:gluconolactonase
VQDFLTTAKGNGNTLDLQGRLITCQHEARNVVRREADGTWTVLAERFDGKAFNSPNDVAVRNDGTIWFTDPTYGLERRKSEQKDNGVYRLDPASGAVTMVQTEFHEPNGICFAPDQQRVYVADSGRKARIGAFPIEKNGTLGKAVFWIEGGADGMRCDQQGNLWAAQFDSIHVFSPEGKRLLEIECPELPTNCAFGGADGKTLFVTARRFLLSMPVKVAGAPVPPPVPNADTKAR